MHIFIRVVILTVVIAASLAAQPQIFAVSVDSLGADAFKVIWTSFRPGTTKLLYGRGESLTDSIESTVTTTSHAVVVTGLEEGTMYAFRAVSSNTTGTSESSKRYVVTPSPLSTGVIDVAFNFSVDTSLPLDVTADGSVDLGQRLLQRIQQAAHSIDLALYSFSDYTSSAPDIARTIADALVAAKNRGVKVRMVYDNRNNTIPVNTLLGAGIPVIKRTTSSGLMHNKFWIIDARDSTSATDDWVITGSWNMTDGGTYLESQDAVFIQDRSLALIYLKEFEEMFGSSGDTPNTTVARFGPQKTDNTPHWTYVGDTRVDVYFSPSDGTNSIINSSLASANENIFFALLVFTRDDLSAMIQSRASAGVVVKGVVNDISVQGSEFQPLRDAGLDVLQAQKQGATSYKLHHKYGIVDPFNDASDPLVIMGSHNWSSSADTDNDENMLVIRSGAIARRYVREFSHRYTESGGVGPVVSVAPVSGYVPDAFTLSDVFPNPFNPSTSFELTLPERAHVEVMVTDILGRTVHTFMDGEMDRGTHRFTWRPATAAGTYLIVARLSSGLQVRKVLFVK